MTIAHYLYIDARLPESFLTDPINHLAGHKQLVLTRGFEKRELFKNGAVLVKAGDKYLGDNRLRRVYDRLFFPYSGSFRRFAGVLRAHGAQLIHAHFATDALEMLPMKRRLRLPLVTSCYGYDVSAFPQKRVNHLRLQRLFREGELFLVLSRDMKRDLLRLGCPEDKIAVHHLGVDLQHFRPPANRPRRTGKRVRFLCVGFFVEKKGYLVLLEALARLVANGHREVELVIVGQGPLEQKIKAHIRALDLAERVRLVQTTERAQVVAQYQASDLFVLPSLTASDGNKEGTPTVLMEAQAVGLPVISTYHAGIPEVVLDGETGWLVPEKDVEALAQKMEHALASRDAWHEMGARGRAHVEREFNIRTQVVRLEQWYRELVPSASK